ncbi:MAG: phosphatidylserine decarboxylase family protein [Candidatus Sumerlaeia bacterium]|nr:phosphatidylserine decarboxylase family protein [Candidatus Sumerlaeia bacterium]
MDTEQRFRIPLAKEGLPFVVPLVGVTIALWLIGWKIPAAIVGAAALFVIYFFRDPERKAPRIAGALLSAADGRVTAIEEVAHPAFPESRARRISVFLSLFSVHINRSPIAAQVEAVEYRPGEFFSATREESAEKNERNRIQLRNGPLRIVVDQIAGVIARRIVCTCKVGDTVEQGQRIGLIRFGSRTDVYVPLDAEVRVKKGMKVRGGETVLAVLPAVKE